ncbi:hypothetical protein [Mesorhizobium sp. NZP2298]|uniref:hypothetical protein n=1 Tax=Mesorhizobium sp. NZP2298 TaxID=2483403 RepID=UPI001556E778|nr:hypothetical protein [Mesorhizobium sp. NZP2298]QKC98280.1 hypothetical protein EB231_29260 [Mesorhizobium sp. NZP2298]
MPIRHKAHEAGNFDPSEVELLGRVFDQLKTDFLTEERDALASRIIANYMAGIKDETELLTLSKQPLGR